MHALLEPCGGTDPSASSYARPFPRATEVRRPPCALLHAHASVTLDARACAWRATPQRTRTSRSSCTSARRRRLRADNVARCGRARRWVVSGRHVRGGRRDEPLTLSAGAPARRWWRICCRTRLVEELGDPGDSHRGAGGGDADDLQITVTGDAARRSSSTPGSARTSWGAAEWVPSAERVLRTVIFSAEASPSSASGARRARARSGGDLGV